MRNLFLPLALVGALTCGFAQTVDTAKLTSSKKAFPPDVILESRLNPEAIRAHVRFLASDLLEGRGTGQRGGDIAAEYIGTMFASYGLKPLGDNGTYIQKVPMVGVTTKPQSTFTLTTAKGNAINLKFRADIVALNETATPSVDIDAPIVWVGYGITAPEYNWDDYKGLDVKGKVLLMLVNEPPSNNKKFFNGPALTYYGRWTYKYEQAARMGAAAVILVHQSEMASYGWDVVRNSWGGEHSYLRNTNAPKLKAASWVQNEYARKLLADSGMDLQRAIEEAGKPGFKGQELKATFKAHLESAVRPFDSNNIIAELQGSDAKLKDQAVVYSAHYDHLGIDSGKSGDNIYNGAVDNGTGCGILLEIARVFAESAAKPKRSIVFAAVTGEEQGLLGSEFLGQHSPIPPKNIMLDLNYDALPPIGIPEEVSVGGSERTTFYPFVQQTAAAMHLGIIPDAHPGAGHYYRSDHFSFARVGVPGFSINEGQKFAGHDRNWGEAQAKDYNENHYHQPSDDYRPEMDFRGDALMAKFGIALGWKAATQPERIEWLAGDEFEKPRKASEQ